MEGPQVAVHMNSNGKVIYGWERGRHLVKISDAFIFKDDIWFLVLWEGCEMPEAVPAGLMNDNFPLSVIEYYESIAILN